MMEFRTLGSVQLDDRARPDARQIASQPKRMALLVYLTLARPLGPQRRDSLLALLWPEASQDRGRQVLRQTLHLLRQALGPDVIVSTGADDVAIDQAHISCDALHFERAIAQGDLTKALELYAGDFLHGFHVADASQEFEEWVAEERRRLRAMATTAARTLAAQEERSGSATSAMFWARRAAQLDRDNEDAVRDLMRLHVRVGDRLGAIQVFEEYALRAEREYGAKPSAELARLNAELKSAGAATLPEYPGGDGAIGSSAAAPSIAKASSQPPPSTTQSRARGRWLIGAALAVIAAVGALWYSRQGTARAPLLAVGSIAQVTGPDSSAESAVAADLLATSLARLRGIEVIPEVRLYDIQAQLKSVGASPGLLSAARHAGASQILRGTMRRLAAGRLSLDGQILDLSSGSVIHAFHAEGADLFELVDNATEAVASLVGAQAPPLPIREITTRSLVAYRLYQEGLRAIYFDADYRAGQGLFRAALDEDSTFAMAAYYSAIVAVVLLQPEAEGLMQKAARLAGHAPDRERLVIRYRIANAGQTAEALALGETLSVRYPNDLDAIFARGSLLQRSGQWGAAAAQFRRVVEADSLSLRSKSARCVACDAYVELWWSWVYGDSMPAAESTARESLRRQGLRGSVLDLLAVSLARQNKSAEALARWHELYDSLTPGPSGANLQRAWVAIREGDFTTADDTLNYLRRAAPASLRSEATWYLAISLRNQGRVREALALPNAGGVPFVALFEAGRYAGALVGIDASMRNLVRTPPGSFPKQMSWSLTHAATALAAQRDTMRLGRIADSLEAVGARSNFGRDPPLHHYVRGLLWLARRDTARAADEFRRSVWSWSDGYTRANYELARALNALGRSREAIYPLQSALRGDLQSSNMYVTRTELREQLAQAFAAVGQRDSARAEYQLVARAWAHADKEFAERRVRAEAYLATVR